MPRPPPGAYPFDVFAKGIETPAGAPVTVVTAIAGEAFLRAYEITGEQAHLDTAHAAASWMRDALPRIPGEGDTHCFAYAVCDKRRVHNANLLAAAHLAAVSARTGDGSFLEAARPAVAFSLAAQREDGAWPYGAWSEGEPYEAELLGLVDNHHTGFVLRALAALHTAQPEEDALLEALRKGWRFYRKLFSEDGMPRNEYGTYPVDVHACAEGILCPSVIAPHVRGAQMPAVLALRWAWYNLRRHADGAPYYRKYPGFRARIVFPRWGLAWLHYALAEYLYAFQERSSIHYLSAGKRLL